MLSRWYYFTNLTVCLLWIIGSLPHCIISQCSSSISFALWRFAVVYSWSFALSWTIIYDLSCEFCPVEHKHENNGIPSIFRWSGDNKISLCNILIEQGLSLFHSKCIVNVNESYFLALLLIIESGWCKTNCGRIYMFSLLSLFAKSGNPCN